MEPIRSVTCSAPVNIAVIKYWGKRDETLILPTNSSLSVTLSQDHLKATTTIALSKSFPQDRIWLNGSEQSISNPRLQSCLREVRRLSQEQHGASPEFEGCVHIVSVNNFPTAAGLASSAAGYAALVYTLSKLFKLEGDISRIARQGSGSACRSVYGGFVKWDQGTRDDGADSIAVQLSPYSHWPELEVIVCVVNSQKKAVSSTSGMQSTVATSTLMEHRINTVVPHRISAMEAAISNKDFQSFTKLTMQDSNQFHALCLDTYPPIFYLNETSRKIINMVTRYNQLEPYLRVAYTFDAGPNAVLLVRSKDVPQVLDMLAHYFLPSSNCDGYFRGISADIIPQPLPKDVQDGIAMDPMPGLLQYIIHTRIGDGPRVLADPCDCLVGENGLPK